jgi:gliding motility-associated-like protein
MKGLTLFTTGMLILFSACGKSDSQEAFTEHCDHLVTDVRKAGDNGSIAVGNAFSPNGDGLNDVFRPLIRNIQSISLKVFDSRGKLVFTTNHLHAGWVPNFGGNRSEKFHYRIGGVTSANARIGICGDVYALSCFPVNLPKTRITFEDQYSGSGFTGVTHEALPVCR